MSGKVMKRLRRISKYGFGKATQMRIVTPEFVAYKTLKNNKELLTRGLEK